MVPCHDSGLPSPRKHDGQEDCGLEEARKGVCTQTGDTGRGNARDSPIGKPEHVYLGDLCWRRPNRLAEDSDLESGVTLSMDIT